MEKNAMLLFDRGNFTYPIIVATACISILDVENDYLGEGTLEPPEVGRREG